MFIFVVSQKERPCHLHRSPVIPPRQHFFFWTALSAPTSTGNKKQRGLITHNTCFPARREKWDTRSRTKKATWRKEALSFSCFIFISLSSLFSFCPPPSSFLLVPQMTEPTLAAKRRKEERGGERRKERRKEGGESELCVQ